MITRRHNLSRSSRSGFTLVELLVVIAIVGLLAALLFPVFASARRKAGQATCQSNLHQVGRAFAMYVSDWDGRWPPGIQGVGLPDAPWGPKIQPFLKTKTQNLVCPQAVRGKDAANDLPGYAMNSRIYSYHDNGLRNLDGSRIIFSIGLPEGRIQFPATTVAVCDAAWGLGTQSSTNPWEHMLNPPDPLPEDAARRHEKGANYLFCDGHVKWYTPDSVLPDRDFVQDGSQPSFALAWKQ